MTTLQTATAGAAATTTGGPGGDPRDAARRRPRSAPARRRSLTMVGLALPALVLMVLVNAYPVLYAAFQSVHQGSLMSTGPFVGADNYVSALTDPLFWQAARFTALFTVVAVFGSWLVGLAFALVLRQPMPGRGLYRVLLLLPWVVPTVVSAMSWNWLTATQSSLLPQLAAALGFGDVLFLADPRLAVVTVCVFKVWISFPFMMLMLSSALEGVDANVYEAARVDGATRWQMLRHLTLPLISRTTYISWVLMAMFSINDFPTIYLLTGGGPVDATTSLVVLAYRTVFQNFQPGYGVAVAFIMTAILVTISLALHRSIRKAPTA